MDIPIIFEDDFLLVIDKPVGISVTEEEGGFVTGLRSEKSETVKDWVKHRYKFVDCVGGHEDQFEQRFGIVHRLDKETSGVLLVAKTKEVFDYLKGLFKYRRIHKEYQALVYRIITDGRFEISAPVGRDKDSGTAFNVDEGGRQSTTEFKVVKRIQIPFPSTYLFAYPKTGRTHQIRVHLKAFGHPVVNDHKYASRIFLESSKNFSTRMMLHAKSIDFTDWDGKKRLFASSINLTDFFINRSSQI